MSHGRSRSCHMAVLSISISAKVHCTPVHLNNHLWGKCFILQLRHRLYPQLGELHKVICSELCNSKKLKGLISAEIRLPYGWGGAFGKEGKEVSTPPPERWGGAFGKEVLLVLLVELTLLLHPLGEPGCGWEAEAGWELHEAHRLLGIAAEHRWAQEVVQELLSGMASNTSVHHSATTIRQTGYTTYTEPQLFFKLSRYILDVIHINCI